MARLPGANQARWRAVTEIVLITNDDGIECEGLKLLADLAREHSDDLWIVAPDSERSGSSHSISLADTVRVGQLGPKTFSVRGSPAACVALGASARSHLVRLSS